MDNHVTPPPQEALAPSYPPDSVGLVATRLLTLGPERPLRLESGAVLAPLTVAYETYGELNTARDNAILICHALSGSAHAAGYHGTGAHEKPGWWELMIGPGKAIDTTRWFVISSNFLGSCYGTTGPTSTDPATGRPWGIRFPVFTIRDMVELQRLLLDEIGHRAPARRGRRFDGRDAGAAVGHQPPGPRRGCHSRSRLPPECRRRGSPSTRSGAARSSATRSGAAATTPRATRRRTACRWRG